MPKFVRVTDPSTGHQFDASPSDSRVVDGTFTVSKAKDAVIEGPFARPRQVKLRTDLAGNPAGASNTSPTTAQEA